LSAAAADTTIGAVVVTHDSGEAVLATLRALAAQLGPGDALTVIDNASSDGTPAAVRAAIPSAHVIETGANLGFAAACNRAAVATGGDLLLFLNPDARPDAGCIAALRSAAAERPGWGAWQALVTLPGGREVNTSGGIVHFLGFGWAGDCDEPVAGVAPEPHEVPFASGAALVVRRGAWERAGGFDAAYFMYAEDLELSLRLRLMGCGVGVVPAARVEHDYDFDKGAYKWFLLERNRWRTLVRVYPGALLALLLPALLAFELALLPLAARGGWLGPKLRAQMAALALLPSLLRERRAVQATRSVPVRTWAQQALSARLDSPFLKGPARMGPAVALQAAYWRAVLACLPRGR
jgi:N-acetylglucosaminyl-diphospho-decaprenol L-rhamnosyltransferase